MYIIHLSHPLMNIFKMFPVITSSPMWHRFVPMIIASLILHTLLLFMPFSAIQNPQQTVKSNNSSQPVEVLPTPPKWQVFAQDKIMETSKLPVGNQVSRSFPNIPKGVEIPISSSVPIPKVTITKSAVAASAPSATVESKTKLQTKSTKPRKPAIAKVKPTSTPVKAKAKPKPTAIAKSPQTPPAKSNLSVNKQVKLASLEFTGYPEFPKYNRSQITSIQLNPAETAKRNQKISLLQTPDSIDAVVDFYANILVEKGYSIEAVISETDAKVYEINQGEEKLFLHLFTQPQKKEVIMLLAPQQLSRKALKI